MRQDHGHNLCMRQGHEHNFCLRLHVAMSRTQFMHAVRSLHLHDVFYVCECMYEFLLALACGKIADKISACGKVANIIFACACMWQDRRHNFCMWQVREHNFCHVVRLTRLCTQFLPRSPTLRSFVYTFVCLWWCHTRILHDLFLFFLCRSCICLSKFVQNFPTRNVSTQIVTRLGRSQDQSDCPPEMSGGSLLAENQNTQIWLA